MPQFTSAAASTLRLSKHSVVLGVSTSDRGDTRRTDSPSQLMHLAGQP